MDLATGMATSTCADRLWSSNGAAPAWTNIQRGKMNSSMIHLATLRATQRRWTGCTRDGVYAVELTYSNQWRVKFCSQCMQCARELEWVAYQAPQRGYTTPGRLLTKAYTGCQVRRQKITFATVVEVDGTISVEPRHKTTRLRSYSQTEDILLPYVRKWGCCTWDVKRCRHYYQIGGRW